MFPQVSSHGGNHRTSVNQKVGGTPVTWPWVTYEEFQGVRLIGLIIMVAGGWPGFQGPRMCGRSFPELSF